MPGSFSLGNRRVLGNKAEFEVELSSLYTEVEVNATW